MTLFLYILAFETAGFYEVKRSSADHWKSYLGEEAAREV